MLLQKGLRIVARSALAYSASFGDRPGKVYRTLERIGGRLSSETTICNLPNGCRIACKLSDVTQRRIFWLGAVEPAEAYLFSLLLKPGMNIVDAGANIGQYTLLAAAQVSPSGSVHSFEPVPRTFQSLEANVYLNRLTNVRLNRAALWHEDGVVDIEFPHAASRHSGAARVRSSGNDAGTRALSLDNYVAQCGVNRVDLIKMDIEGAEAAAIDGAMATLKRDTPIIFMEICPTHLARLGASPAKIWRRLAALGYRAWEIGESAADSGPMNDLEGLPWLTNVILHSSELPSSVTTGWTFQSVLNWARSGERLKSHNLSIQMTSWGV